MRSRRLTALVLIAAILLVAAVPAAVQQLAVAPLTWTGFAYVPVRHVGFVSYTPTVSAPDVPDSAAPRAPPLS